MNQESIAFIGAGNMGGAMVRAACKATAPENVCICDHNPAKTDALRAQCGCAVVTAEQAVRSCRYVVLAVKPQVFAAAVNALLPTLAACADKETVLVSVAAGVSVREIRAMLGELPIPIVRIMPNTPAAVGEGLLLMVPDETVLQPQYDTLCKLLSDSGMLERVTESVLEKAMSVFSCSPAYTYMFIEAMADGAVQLGLPRALAQRYAAQAVKGAAAMVLETGEHPGALKDAVCSPGGYTIRGVAELEKRGFRAACAQAVLVSGGAST